MLIRHSNILKGLVPIPEQSKSQVSLTFDDGPDRKYTPRILNILKSFKVKASFFLVGKRAEKYPDIVRRILEEGHDIGNHTYSHPISPIFKHRIIEREIKVTDKIIEGITGYRPRFFRPTWSRWHINYKKMMNIAKNLDYFSVGWTISSIDWLGAKRIIKHRVLNRDINHGDIILFHDGAEKALFPKREATVSVLPEILRTLHKRNILTFKLSELLDGRDKTSV